MNQSETTAWTCVVLTCAHGRWDVADVINGAFFRAELQGAWDRTLQMAEANRPANESGAEPDDSVLQEMSEQFRVDRDLISAEETEEWLQARGLTLEEFSTHFLRRYRMRETDVEANRQRMEYSSAPEELRDMLRVELFLSGEFDRLASHLAWRVAAYEEISKEVGADWIERERVRFRERFGVMDESVTDWLSAIGRDEAWLELQLEMEGAFEAQKSSLISQDALEREIVVLRLPLTRFVVEYVEVDSLDSAREAMLCVREDNLPLDEVARLGGYPYRKTKVRFESLGEAVQHAFLRAGPGEVLQPLDLGEGFQICRVIEKLEPRIEDPDVRERLEAEITERHFTELVAKHVRWALSPAIE